MVRDLEISSHETKAGTYMYETETEIKTDYYETETETKNVVSRPCWSRDLNISVIHKPKNRWKDEWSMLWSTARQKFEVNDKYHWFYTEAVNA